MSEQELSDHDIDMIAERVIERIADRGWIDRETHYVDHQWVQAKRQGEDTTKDSRRRIIEQIVGTAGAAGLLGLLGWVGVQIIETIVQMADKLPK